MMAFTDSEVMWATQLALARFQHRRSHYPTEDNFRVFGTVEKSSFILRDIEGAKRIYSAYVSDGVVYLKRIPMFFTEDNPYYDASKWIADYSFGTTITDVAIAFDGYWVRNYTTKRLDFVSEEEPWFFYIDGGALYAKKYQGEPVQLSADAVKCGAIRGWMPVDDDYANDQGLIVAYIKADGLVYYRAYCLQEDGSKLWEVERCVSELTGVNTEIEVFKTNDFRVGFVSKVGSELRWALTTRNWAGMSVWPEHLTAGITDVILSATRVYSTDNFMPNEYVLAGIVPEIIPRYTLDDNLFKTASNDGATTVNAKTQYFLTALTASDFLIVDEDDTEFAVTDVQYGATWQDLILTVNDLSYSAEGSDLTLKFLGSGTTKGSDGQDVVAFELTFTPTGITYQIPDPPVVEAIWNE